MLRPAALALLGLVLAAGCGGNSAPFTEGEGGEASGAESSGGASATGAGGGTSGSSGTSAGGVGVGVGGSSGASGNGGTGTGGVTNGGTGVGGTDMGGTDAGGTDAGGTGAGGSGGAQGGGAGRAGSGGVAGAAAMAGAGGSAGAITTDPECPVRQPASMTSCPGTIGPCPYDPSGCRCLLVQGDRCFQIDTGCFAMAPDSADRIAPPPARYCICSVTNMGDDEWSCAPQ